MRQQQLNGGMLKASCQYASMVDSTNFPEKPQDMREYSKQGIMYKP
jgi:hypothetical protein